MPTTTNTTAKGSFQLSIRLPVPSNRALFSQIVATSSTLWSRRTGIAKPTGVTAGQRSHRMSPTPRTPHPTGLIQRSRGPKPPYNVAHCDDNPLDNTDNVTFCACPTPWVRDHDAAAPSVKSTIAPVHCTSARQRDTRVVRSAITSFWHHACLLNE